MLNAWSLAVGVITVLVVLVLVVYEPVCTVPAYSWTPWRRPHKVTVSYGWAPVPLPPRTPPTPAAPSCKQLPCATKHGTSAGPSRRTQPRPFARSLHQSCTL